MNPENIELAFIVQASGNVGEAKDFSGVPTRTHLMVHGWADPYAPQSFLGARVNRNFLLGIFEPEYPITNAEMGENYLIKTPVFVHDNRFSPRTSTSLLYLHRDSPSQSFWSVVIDKYNPDGQVRALVCLHWILNNYSDEWIPMLKDFLAIIRRRNQPVPAVENFGEFLEKINQSAYFKGTEMLKRLNKLMSVGI